MDLRMRHFFSRLGHFLINGGRRHRVLASVVVTTFCSACVVGDFQGDGRLVDRGPFAQKDRYVLDLGPVDLSRTGKYTYTMNNLPDTYFVAGLKIIEVEPDRGGSRPPHLGRLRLLLETSNHDVVISEDSALDSWTWSSVLGSVESFLYRKGKQHWISNKDGTTSPVFDDVRTDEGWGSFFLPRRGVTYHLVLEVLEAQTQPRPTYLLLKGGGWK